MRPQPLKRTRCTAYLGFDADGNPAPKVPCGRVDMCARVIVRAKGTTVRRHWVCGPCRERMKLPDHGVVMDTFTGELRPWRG